MVAIMTTRGPQESSWWRCEVSTFESVKKPRPARRVVSWPSLCASLTKWRQGESKTSIPLWSPAIYPENCDARRKSRVIAVSCLVLDYDEGTPLREAHLQWAEFPHIMHTSWSHTKEHPKCRVVVPLLRPVEASGWARVFHWALQRAPTIDTQCSDPSRIFFMPSHPVGAGGAWAKAWAPESGFLSLDPETLPPTPAEVKAEALRNRPPRRVGFGQGRGAARRAVSEALKTQESARVTAAQQLGATITTGLNPRADKIKCPTCGRNSVHYMLTPGAWNGARCSHRNSCGWVGWVDQLLESM